MTTETRTPDTDFRPAKLLGRGLVRHCPRCGGGKLFANWFRMSDACPHCRYVFNREEGFWLGAYVINFVVMELGMAVILFLYVMMEAQNRNPNTMRWVLYGIAEAIIVPVLFYPFSKTTWAAVDLILHHGKLGEKNEVLEQRRAAALAARDRARAEAREQGQH